MAKPLHIAVACGGTGGHIFPGLATAERLVAHGHKVTLWLAGRDVESTSVSGWNGPVRTIPAEGFPSGFSLRALRSGVRLAGAIRQSRAALAHDRPDAILAMGSYASAGPVMAATLLGIPSLLHEANVIPGRAIALLSRWARAVAVHFPETQTYFPKRRVEAVGMPLRASIENDAAHVNAPESRSFTFVVMGGSAGSHRLNRFTPEAFYLLRRRGLFFRVIHIAGPADELPARKSYQAADIEAEVFAFTQDMASVYRRAHYMVCRSGASTCAELSAFGIPALLVPYPHATRGHQLANAHAMAAAGAAVVAEEKDLTAEWLADHLAKAMSDTNALQAMRVRSKARGALGAAERLAGLVEHAAEQGNHTEAGGE